MKGHEFRDMDEKHMRYTGSFYTPSVWVMKSQEYLQEAFDNNYQDSHYIWDCSAGSGNLLAGLTNKYNVFASTLDKQDVDIMHQRIENGANLLPEHVFQFDFLNDDFTKLPRALQDIINDKEKRKNLIIYINPPYAEAARSERDGNKAGVAVSTIASKYKNVLGKATNELYTQFLMRIYKEISGCKIGEFSTLKALQSPNFSTFRSNFKASLESMFIVPADTFDNVKGKFPIGFKIWDTDKIDTFTGTIAHIYDKNNVYRGDKIIHSYDGKKLINEWYKKYYDIKGDEIGILNIRGNDIQNHRSVYVSSLNNNNHTSIITLKNIKQACIYYAVRKSIDATWMNDRDQFLYPNDAYKDDIRFHNDCLAYTLFTNNIQYKHCKDGKNHFIPFTEQDINARTRYKSSFMTDYINGKYTVITDDTLLDNGVFKGTKLQFTDEAIAVFDSARELYKYYHSHKNSNPDAALYDIKEYFQGRKEDGKMKTKILHR